MKKFIWIITSILFLLEIILIFGVASGVTQQSPSLDRFAAFLGISLFILVPIIIYKLILQKSGFHIKAINFAFLEVYLLSFFGLEMSYYVMNSGAQGLPRLMALQFGLRSIASDDLIFFFMLFSSWILTCLLSWILSSGRSFFRMFSISVPLSIGFGAVAFFERYTRLYDNPYYREDPLSLKIFEPTLTIVIPAILITIITYFIFRKFFRPQEINS